MNTKNTTMLVVSLIVGVVLITGVVTPIISDAINDGSDSSSAEGMRYVYNPTPYRYVDILQMYEDGVISDDGITISEVEGYLGVWAGMPMVTVIVQWAGDETPTYLVGGEFYATDGTNTAMGLYMTDLDLENRTCMYNVDMTGDGDLSPVSKTFTSLKLLLDGNFDPGSAWETYYAQSTEGMYYGDIELASLDGITTIGVATTGGSDDALATLDAFAVDESLIYPVGGTVSRTMSFSDHILSEVSYTYTSGGSSGAMDDIFIIAPTKAQYETDDGKISGTNAESIGRFVDGHSYMNVMYGDDTGDLPIAGGQGLYDFNRVSPAITAIVTTDDEIGPIVYGWEYIPPYTEYSCVSSGPYLDIANSVNPTWLYMEGMDWTNNTCDTFFNRAGVGIPDFHFESVMVLMKESDIMLASDPVGAWNLYDSATLGAYNIGSDIRVNSLEDVTVIGQEVTEGKSDGLVWAVNGENMTSSVEGTLTYTPAYADHILSGAAYSFRTSDATLDMMAIGVVAPVSFEYDAGSGGSGGLSPTLTAVLPIIPLLMAVGLVIAAVGYVRMKN